MPDGGSDKTTAAASLVLLQAALYDAKSGAGDRNGVAWLMAAVGVREAVAWRRHGEAGAGQSTGGAMMV